MGQGAPRVIDPHTALIAEVALECRCDQRTVRRFLAGEVVRELNRAKLEEECRKRNLIRIEKEG
jgi:hypothetical protein